ncbi:flagellar hook-length control protein FliK [Ningiella sp. W23]|uniref:flagellar hook-length control protein FliK n=1 Tax=Ningiella sp. W23 TaxID=3023715 RepID=UPI0037568AAB
MMQQFATPSSKSAVSSLPFDMVKPAVSEHSGQSAQAANGYEDRRSAFERAIADAENGAFAQSSAARPSMREGSKEDSGRFRSDDNIAYTQPVEHGNQENDKGVDSKSATDDHSKDLMRTATYNEPVSEAALNEATTEASNGKSSSSADLNAAAETDGEQVLSDAQILEQTIERDSPLEEANIDNFPATPEEQAFKRTSAHSDEVEFLAEQANKVLNQDDFFSDVKALNEQSNEISEGVSEDEQGFSPISIHSDTVELLAKHANKEFNYVDFVSDVKALNEQSSEISEGVSEDEQAKDLISISLTEDELQIILDAQKAGVSLYDIFAQDELAQEQLDKLTAAITKMLNQFHEQNTKAGETDNNNALSEESLALDKALLENMLHSSNPTDDSEQALNASIEQAAAKDLEHIGKTLDAQNQQILSESEAKASSDLNNGKSLQAQDVQLNDIAQRGETAISDEVLDVAQTRQTDEEALSNSANAQSSGKMPVDAQINVKAPNEQDMLKQLALLDERSQTNTIENIKSRVEKFAADLGAQQKGSEFVAAMQSGLKEFKEQLQSGREPGIDLKSLVSDALAQANVEIPPQQTSKVDSALAQFSNILGLANSVSQSVQSQQNQMFTLNEVSLIKESASLNTEGTKLAQATVNNLDKAVNIFKPDGQQQLAEKVRWMVNGRNPAAEIRLDPPELGAMQIRVNLNGDAASVNFSVQSMQAKEALDQALPKLREMLQEQGIELGQSSVQQDSNGGSQANDEGELARDGSSGSRASETSSEQAMEDATGSVIEQRVAGSALGGIDYFV